MDNYFSNILSLKKPNFLFGFFFSILIVMMLWQITIKENVYQNITNYDAKITKQIKINQFLSNQNKQLTLELNISNNKKIQLLESQARYKLGMIKKGEIYYSYE